MQSKTDRPEPDFGHYGRNVAQSPDSSGVALRIGEDETYRWARTPGAAWPCSDLSETVIVASFDETGLTDLDVRDADGNEVRDFSADEFNAITADYLRGVLAPDHPAYFVTVGQFS